MNKKSTKRAPPLPLSESKKENKSTRNLTVSFVLEVQNPHINYVELTVVEIY